MQNFIVRQFSAGDLEGCRRLWTELTEWHRDLYRSPGIGGENPGFQFDAHLELIGQNNLWVAESKGKLIGLTGMIPGEAEAELEPIVVSPAYRGQGVGRKLVEAVIAQARERGVRELKVRPVARNEEALQFFHEMGFTLVGHIELFQELQDARESVWRDGVELAGLQFKF